MEQTSTNLMDSVADLPAPVDNTSPPAGKTTNSITVKERSVPIANIVRLPSLRMREKLDDATVKKYATAMADGAVFPPVEIMQVGSRFLLTGGWHRTAAAERNGSTTIWASVRPGEMEGAILAAARADAHGGLKRTNEDKRKAVKALLATEWAKDNSDHVIADAAGVSQPFVSKLRPPSTDNGYQLPPKRKGKDRKQRSIDPMRLRPPRSTTRGRIARTMKLGEATVAKIKNTTLDSAAEMDALIELSRINPSITERVAEAASGTTVSAVAEVTRIKEGGALEHDNHDAGNGDLDHGDHGAGADDQGGDQDDDQDEPAVSPAPKAKEPSKRSILEIWNASSADDRDLIRSLVLTEYFVNVTGAELFQHILANNRGTIVSELLDRLGAEGLRQTMSPELKRELSQQQELPPPRTAPEIELGEDGYPNPSAGLQRLH